MLRTPEYVDGASHDLTLAMALLLDATVVRVLVPATMALIGERNWYPRVGSTERYPTSTSATERRAHDGPKMAPRTGPVALAGTITLFSVVLAVTISRWFLLLTAFVGINQWLYVAVGDCPASLVLRRLGFRRDATRLHEHGVDLTAHKCGPFSAGSIGAVVSLLGASLRNASDSLRQSSGPAPQISVPTNGVIA